jgi:hypothetical protein
MKTNLDTILIDDFDFKIKPDTTIIDKVHPKFMYIDKNTWESYTEEEQNKIKQKIYVLPFNNFITLANETETSDKKSVGLIFHPVSDTEYTLLREKAIGGYDYEDAFNLQQIMDLLEGHKK